MLTHLHEFEISNKIKRLIEASGLEPADWYVGITKDENQRNARGRGVDIEDAQNYFCEDAETRTSACRIETHMIKDYGTDGGEPCNGGDDESTFVYAINKTVYPINEGLIAEMQR